MTDDPALAYAEQPVWIDCNGEQMLGILTEPRRGLASGLGVLIIVGGPQYRIGSHRQFVLLARRLAAAGHVCLRFDYRGMGDSEGTARTFEDVADDVRAALDFLCAWPGVRAAVVWGLCDAASAALMFGADDSRVRGLVLVNPWVRSEVTLARTHLKHYYLQRLFERGFWSRVLRGRLQWRASVAELARSLQRAARLDDSNANFPFQKKMADRWRRFRWPILLALSGRDFTAREFLECAAADSAWHGLLTQPNVQRVDLADADHTFSATQWRAWLEDRTLDWLSTVSRIGLESAE